MQSSSLKMSAATQNSDLPCEAAPGDWSIHVHIGSQTLELRKGQQLLHSFPVSTSAWGIGHEEGSNKTPVGRFNICQKIGQGAPLGMVFKSRVPTGQIGTEEDSGDLVQSRILWLHGLEPHNANTRERYIYIHGTNHESRIGSPCSHGCVRMRNADVVTLFELVSEGTGVTIG